MDGDAVALTISSDQEVRKRMTRLMDQIGISYILEREGRSPSFVVGSTIGGVGESSMVGRGPHFVVEACEYDRSFHNFHPHIAVTTNIERDHLDYYRNVDELVEAFAEFALADPDHGPGLRSRLRELVGRG